ncbi:hypothetical protein FHW77_004803 [Agrobacterium sp. RC10-4-1]|uniref:hypothetical protein n=1 Tax=Agrobacterium sp. RC10-4-1 TaxID=2587039 RepID=UPI0015FBE5EA|nr:hypothetical protein [Agrobacterium sp. RC10-4-1]MBA8801048.1 hypothetical protein [Agrobacterium sp. RC10-4-1]
MLTAACRDRLVNAGATLIGPLRSPADILDALMEEGVDAAILDVGADDETLVSASIILEAANVPSVFASGPPGASSTLH